MKKIILTAKKLRQIIQEEMKSVNEGIYSKELPSPIGTTGSMYIDDEFMDFVKDYIINDEIDYTNISSIKFSDMDQHDIDMPLATVTFVSHDEEFDVSFVYLDEYGWKENNDNSTLFNDNNM